MKHMLVSSPSIHDSRWWSQARNAFDRVLPGRAFGVVRRVRPDEGAEDRLALEVPGVGLAPRRRTPERGFAACGIGWPVIGFPMTFARRHRTQTDRDSEEERARELGIDLGLIDENLRLTPLERMRQHNACVRQILVLRERLAVTSRDES